MLTRDTLTRTIFFDIETAGEHPDYDALLAANPRKAKLFATRMERSPDTDRMVSRDTTVAPIVNHRANYLRKAGLIPEFGQVVAVVMGLLQESNGPDEPLAARTVVLTGSEHTILRKTALSFSKYAPMQVCGHNIKEFDVPWLAKRMHIAGLTSVIPPQLQTFGRKPWDMPIIDTTEVWGSGGWKDRTSLDLICEVLGLPSPKQEMDGSMVHDAFWAGRVEEIGMYCVQDVIALMRVMCKLANEPMPTGQDG